MVRKHKERASFEVRVKPSWQFSSHILQATVPEQWVKHMNYSFGAHQRGMSTREVLRSVLCISSVTPHRMCAVFMGQHVFLSGDLGDVIDTVLAPKCVLG